MKLLDSTSKTLTLVAEKESEFLHIGHTASSMNTPSAFGVGLCVEIRLGIKGKEVRIRCRQGFHLVSRQHVSPENATCGPQS